MSVCLLCHSPKWKSQLPLKAELSLLGKERVDSIRGRGMGRVTVGPDESEDWPLRSPAFRVLLTSLP